MSIIETVGGEHGRVYQMFIYQFESTYYFVVFLCQNSYLFVFARDSYVICNYGWSIVN